MSENINPNPNPKVAFSRRDFLEKAGQVLAGGVAAGVGATVGSGEAEARVRVLEGPAAVEFEKTITDMCAKEFAGKLVKTNSISAKILGGGPNTLGPLTVGVYDDKQIPIGEVVIPARDRSMLINRVTVSMIGDLLEAKGYLKK